MPPEQVIDTVDLYFLKSRQRRLSLRFLSWFVLHEHIQTDAHDSVEDARSALKLYKAYNSFREAGTFDEKLDELYAEGRLYVSQFAVTLSSLTYFDVQNFRPPQPISNSGLPDTKRGGTPGYPMSPSGSVAHFDNLRGYSPNWRR